MHYHCEVVFRERPEDVENAVEKALSPFREQDGPDIGHPGGWWDWWQIGGRWTGAHVPGYDAEKDPSKVETCDICYGTGTRVNVMPSPELGLVVSAPGERMKCNGCNGTGKRTSWPTRWVPLEQDVMEAERLPDDLSCYTLVLADTGEVLMTEVWRAVYDDSGEFVSGNFEKTGFDGKVKPALLSRGLTGAWCVTVDYHS